jgi:hypothetical protein
MSNPYKPYLIEFFTKVLDYRHTTERVCRVLLEDSKKYDSENAVYRTGSALIISDLSGPTDNGWELNFHTRVFRETLKEHYSTEIMNLVSRECCLTYAQSFEAFETFLKDILFYETTISAKFEAYVSKFLTPGSLLTRRTMPSGEKLFKVLNRVAGPSLKKLFAVNNVGLKHRETFYALSHARHAIVHSRSFIEMSKISASKIQLDTFKYFFDITESSNGLVEIRLDAPRYKKLLKRFPEYAFQIFKAISVTHRLEYDFELLKDSDTFTSGPPPHNPLKPE